MSEGARSTPLGNWSGNIVYGAGRIVAPRSIEEVQELVARSPRIGFLGSRHSFNAIADSDVLMLMAALPREFSIDEAGATVTVSGGMTYGELAPVLAREGLALANLASLPHISIAGAVATGTHGSGVRNGSLATAVAGIDLVTADGELVTVRRGEPDFEGHPVGLGALGAVVRISLDVEPAYSVRQRVWEHVPLDALLERFDEVISLGYSVSLFTLWDGTIDQVWVKTRVEPDRDEIPFELAGGRPAEHELHPIRPLDPVHCTAQLGVPGPWYERLPHFRLGFTPSNGDELQSEYLVDRRHAVDALAAVASIGERIRPLLQVCEIRTVAADRLWLSMAYGRDSVAIHFTWRPDQERVLAALASVREALSPFDPRPHWGKVFSDGRESLRHAYPKLDAFVELAARRDPRGAFRNPWLERHLFGPG